MSKKIIIITTVIVVLVLAGAFLAYRFALAPKITVESPAPSKGTFSICLDQCGDGICQAPPVACKEGDLSCVCAETQKTCPQDCKTGS